MFGRSQNSASRCLIRKCRFLKVIEYQIVRCVCGLFDFLYHNFFFFAHLRRVKRRVGDKVADNVGCKFQVVLEHFGIKTGEMPWCISICGTADVFDVCSEFLFFVPLNTICSIKCEMPLSASDSAAAPVLTQTPSETVSICGRSAVMILSPFFNVDCLISMLPRFC